ncbi:MAG: hypothetical protein IPK19_04085 [Chloroflexi bacterium]|nr:hypothetical protein [Chloroflexota bacterium]
MMKKLLVGLLLITVIGGVAASLLSQPAASTTSASATATHQPQGRNAQPETTREPANNAVNMVGDAWSSSGTILELTAVGMTLQLEDGSEIFVELGPETYWGAQGVTLLAGADVAVDGFFNGTDYHARAVTTSAGVVLSVRDENGSPLWSGGSSGGSNGGQGEVQIPADQWVTIEGIVTALTNNGLIVQTSDDTTLAVSFGRADFWQQQSVTFAIDDAITLLGFWQGDQFSAGQVTNTATGERILLRDPNGRPLWAGPGRGQGNGNVGQQAAPASAPEATLEATAPVG